MSTLVSSVCTVEPARLLSALDADDTVNLVQPAADLACLCVPRRSPRVHSPSHTSSQQVPTSQNSLETLPVEIINQILSYLTHPRSRLPGLSETQSSHEFSRKAKLETKCREDLTTPADSNRWAADLFDWNSLQHPFHVLSLSSRRCHDFVEGYCAHLVRSCNMFNLPFTQFDQLGPRSVWPDLSDIVYRRLWLQHAPRTCIYCYAVLDNYPFPLIKRVIAACEDCFYRQTLSVDEVVKQYHISEATVRSSPALRSIPNAVWVLRIDVEALALQLYGTRAFHDVRGEQPGKPCTICAITRFIPDSRRTTPGDNQRNARRLKRPVRA
ncbi:hypothetical protein EK21DRAFT_60673 [Setomelanomma holmii]|uniref:Uncharacterized protein n=1 Tax=Setomelanomma holmii TaxID=210430 RepID=A0A9P4LPU8_9PLEO|nr:hypothetical protein EK21DRAFT_60673 [Setomelanomma holmii]